VRVFGGLGIEELVGNVILNSRTRAPVQKIGGGGECLGPVWGGHGGMNQQGASDIIKGAEDTLSFPILRRGVGTGEAQVDASRSQKRCESLIDKLGSVVSLYAANGKTELCIGICTEVCDVFGDFRLVNKRSRPTEM